MAVDFKKWLTIFSGVAPMILLVVPGGQAFAPIATTIIKSIADAQQQPGASGAEKKAFVLQEVADAAAAVNAVKPGTLDPARAVEAAGHAVDAIISSVNAVEQVRAALPHAPAIVTAPAK